MHIFVLLGDDAKGNEVKFVCRRVENPRSPSREGASTHAADATDEAQAYVFKSSNTQRILQIDAVLAKQRDLLSQEMSLAQAVKAYLVGLEAIDFSGCSQAFTAAFQRHRDAWEAAIPFLEQHASLRGEMHQLFEQIGQVDEANHEELARHTQAIMGSWAEVEAAADIARD
jgi:hypothetical protein